MHIESNDIFVLKSRIPNPFLMPLERMAKVAALLREEGALHLNSRALCTHFVLGRAENQQDAGVDELL